jgi:putative ABC transport system ATP-binding protein
MLIQAENIMRSYNSGDARIDALKGCSLSIKTGEFLAITGPSGSGKTTLMNILGLLDRPNSGSLKFQGRNTEGLSETARAKIRNLDIGFIFQSYNLLPRHTAFENVELPMVYAGTRASERRKRALKLLEDIGLATRSGHLPHELSGGEQQRVAVARALANHPNLVLADEPTGALDSKKGLRMLALFQEVNAAGCAVVVITHDEKVARHAQRILRMSDGEIVSDETVQDRTLADETIASRPSATINSKATTSLLSSDSDPSCGAKLSRRNTEDPGSADKPEKSTTDATEKLGVLVLR